MTRETATRPTVIVAAITSRTAEAATHVSLDETLCGDPKQDSTVLTEQIRTALTAAPLKGIHRAPGPAAGVGMWAPAPWQLAWGWNGISSLAEICISYYGTT